MPSGRPDWFGTIVAAGKYGDTYLPIALDVDGFITATMKGVYDAVLKTIAVDSDGIMKANLSVQDLDFLTVRPAYGQVRRGTGSVSITADSTETIATITGKGLVIGGWFRWAGASSEASIAPIIKCDEVVVEQLAANVLNTYQQYPSTANPLYLIKYDDTYFSYIVGICPGLTFETSFEMAANNPYAAAHSIAYHVFYALVP